MTKVTFGSWQEAYAYQLNSRGTFEDPLFMTSFDINSGVEEIDELVATNGKDIVWLVAIDQGNEHYIQYGVGRNQYWYSVEFNGYEGELVEVEGSLKTYAHVANLVSDDSRAIVIYKHIDSILGVYNFLVTGKMMPSDQVNYQYVNNAQRMIDFAKSELAKLDTDNEDEDYYDEGDEDFCCDDNCESCDDDYCCPDELDDVDTEEENEEENSFVLVFGEGYNTEDDLAGVEVIVEEMIEEVEEMLEEAMQESFQEGYEQGFGEGAELGHAEGYNEAYEQLTLFSNEDEDCCYEEIEDVEEEKRLYRISYGDDTDDLEEVVYEVTETEALELYYDVMVMGFKFVELSQIMRMSVIF